MLEVKDLSVTYGQHRALDGAALHVDAGEIVVILGANGAGKSTLLKAVSGICEGRVSGSVSLDGHALQGLGADRIVEEGVALVPEGRGIFGDLTVEENLKLGAYPDRAREDAQMNLERVFRLFPKLTERRRQVARTMSGGEQQMVAIGRAMMSAPRILTLDEPSLGLSPLLCKELFQNLRAVRELGIGILMVEQNARQSLAIADRGYLLENARIVHEDSAQALMHDPAVQAAYLGAGSASASAKPATTKAAATVVATADAAPTEQATPASFQIAAPRAARASAETLVGFSINDLLARADASSKAQAPQSARPMPDSAVQPDTGDVQALLREFEIAAARAGKRREMPPLRTSAKAPTPPAPDPQPDSAAPVTIEVYRAPRVEVYRRRPGRAEFERD